MERGFSIASYEEAINQSSIVLPGELLLEILQRLPVKSLLRFESTSKRWQLIIRNSNFIAKHLLFNHEKYKSRKAEMFNYLHSFHFGGCIDYLQPPFSLCFCPTGISGLDRSQGIALISSKRDDGDIITNAICHSPHPLLNQNISIVGSCNGLVCIRFCRRRRNTISGYLTLGCWDRCFGIWNPATRKFKLLPTPKPAPASEFDILSNTIVGFSYITSTCSYKLVQILIFQTHARVEVLNVCANSWKDVVCQGEAILNLGWKVECLERTTNRYIRNLPVLAKGCLYWLGILKHEYVLESFDLEKEVFTSTAFPYPNDYLKLVVFEDNLAAFNHPDFILIEGYYELWIYEETSHTWTERFTFGPLPKHDRPVGFWADGDIIVKGDSFWGSKPYLYNPHTKEKKKFPCTIEKRCNIVFEPYIESLVDF